MKKIITAVWLILLAGSGLFAARIDTARVYSAVMDKTVPV